MIYPLARIPKIYLLIMFHGWMRLFCKALTILTKTGGGLPEKYEFRLPTEVGGNIPAGLEVVQIIILGIIPMNCRSMVGFGGIVEVTSCGFKKQNPWKLLICMEC